MIRLEPRGFVSLGLGCPSSLGQRKSPIHCKSSVDMNRMLRSRLNINQSHTTELFLSGTEMDQEGTPFFKLWMYTHYYRLLIESSAPDFSLRNTGFHYSLGSQTVWFYLGVSITHMWVLSSQRVALGTQLVRVPPNSREVQVMRPSRQSPEAALRTCRASQKSTCFPF